MASQASLDDKAPNHQEPVVPPEKVQVEPFAASATEVGRGGGGRVYHPGKE